MAHDPQRIRPLEANPAYWQYKGKPALLLGGSCDDNLFQITNLVEHLDDIVAAGGNYIRNTMSHRDPGNVKPFHFDVDSGLYDLGNWDAEYWRRLDTMLIETAARDIIVQVEIWAYHDFYKRPWLENPWRPANNINYGPGNTRLKDNYGYAGRTSASHDFWESVPARQNDELLLRYQQRFVDRLLSHTFHHSHVLYTITNEIHEQQSPEWGWYWGRYIRDHAAARDRSVEVTEMFQQTDITGAQHEASFTPPGDTIYSYFEASQNSVKCGHEHWENLQAVRNRLANAGLVRPVNCTKIYGCDGGPAWTGTAKDAVERFCRNIVGGCASSRFHRADVAPYGLALSPPAVNAIRAMRCFTDAIHPWECEPRNDLLQWIDNTAAYLIASPGKTYGLYLPHGGSVSVDLSATTGMLRIQWINITTGRPDAPGSIDGGQTATITAPDNNHDWAAAIVA